MWIKHPLGKIAVYVPDPKQVERTPVETAKDADTSKKAKAPKKASE